MKGGFSGLQVFSNCTAQGIKWDEEQNRCCLNAKEQWYDPQCPYSELKHLPRWSSLTFIHPTEALLALTERSGGRERKGFVWLVCSLREWVEKKSRFLCISPLYPRWKGRPLPFFVDGGRNQLGGRSIKSEEAKTEAATTWCPWCRGRKALKA